MNDISTMMKLKEDLDQVKSNIHAHADDHSVMIITKEADPSEIEQFTYHVSESGYRNLLLYRCRSISQKQKRCLNLSLKNTMWIKYLFLMNMNHLDLIVFTSIRG